MKSVAYYMGLPYTIILRPDDEGDIVAKIEELPGCSSHGGNPTEALENLKEAQQLWIEDCLDAGQPVPEPTPEEVLPSGKWLQRVPRSLHQKLIRLARRENVSLNQLVTAILAEGTGLREPTEDLYAKYSDFTSHIWDTWAGEWSLGDSYINPASLSWLHVDPGSVVRGRIKSEVMFQHGHQKSTCH